MDVSVFLLILFVADAAYGDTIVKTTCGLVRGTTVSSGKVEAFLGIPYAEPPIGRLRFVKPVPKTPWVNVYDANQNPPACIQATFENSSIVDEDCLYLNLWLPKSRNKSELKAIIIFIHGGGFMLGSSSLSLYDGATLAEYGDVIVVTINYRLGGLGFFSAFIDDAPGNTGMYDQVAAIRWIKENAERFQGDPNNIVLMGHSSGAASVSAHLISPLSKSLFRRAILLSGSILHPVNFDNNNRLKKQCQEYANMLGCAVNGETLNKNAKRIVECMKNLPPEKYVDADRKLLNNSQSLPPDFLSRMLYPRVGDDFLPEITIDSFRKGTFKDTEILLGITRDEGSILLVISAPNLFGMFGENDVSPFFNETSTRQFIRKYVSSGNGYEDEKITKAYMDRVNPKDDYTYVKIFGDVIGDYMSTCGTMFQADFQSLRNNPIYFYMFDFRSPSSVFAKWMGVPHGEELPYVFGNTLRQELSDTEREFSRHVMDRLVTFAKTGNPNSPKSVTWPRYTFADPKYLALGKEDIVKTKPDYGRCEVWRERFRSIIDDSLIQNLKKS